LSEILSRRCGLSWTTSDSAKKSGNFQPKIAFFLFFRRNIWPILSRRSRLSRTWRAPSRL